MLWTKVAAGLKIHRISLEAFNEGHMRKDASVARETSQWVKLLTAQAWQPSLVPRKPKGRMPRHTGNPSAPRQ